MRTGLSNRSSRIKILGDFFINITQPAAWAASQSAREGAPARVVVRRAAASLRRSWRRSCPKKSTRRRL